MKMYDAGKIIAGIIIFVGLITFPFWYNMGKAAQAPKPKLPTKVKECVESTPYMKTSHMQLLNEWRDSVVREGNRLYVAINGRKFDMSLSNMSFSDSCMGCHSSKVEFCDQCHNYVGVKPYCWDCHIAPKESR